MLVTNIKAELKGNYCELSAEISGKALSEHFILWYRFPGQYREYINPDNGNPFLSALLLLAMRTGEELCISGSVSTRLLRNADGPIQEFYKHYDPSLNRIHLKSLDNSQSDYGSTVERKGVGLFFPGGVNSFYSLLKNVEYHPKDLYSFTHLIAIHGFDIQITSEGTALFNELLKKCDAVSRVYGKAILPVATNLRSLSERFVKWDAMYQNAALASVALALESTIECYYYSSESPCPEPGSSISDPVSAPFYQTERCGILLDGYNVTELEKIRFIAQFPVAMDMLRVCNINKENQYNCGRCEKCVRTMIELHIAGALNRCNTLPHTINTEMISHLKVRPYQIHFINELIEALGTTEEDLSIKKALECIPQLSGDIERQDKQSILLNDVGSHDLQDILNSTSWRITKPLRIVYDAPRNIKSFFVSSLKDIKLFFVSLFKNPEHYSFVYAACHLRITKQLLKIAFRNKVLISYWNEERDYVNFGDYVTKVLISEFGYKSVEYCNAELLNILDKFDFCLLGVGSNLNKHTIEAHSIHNKVYIWGCGNYFDSDAKPYNSNVKFFSVRGPVTARHLKLNAEIPMGDLAFLMPLFFKAKKIRSQYKITYIPHCINRENWNFKKDSIGAERYVDIICSRRKFWSKLNEIVSSKFVLTNSLHAAIFCHAYGVPWALCLADGDELNIPDKWRDLFEYLGIDSTGNIVRNYQEGLNWWNNTGSKAKIRDLLPIVEAFPLPIKNKKVLSLLKKMKANQFLPFKVTNM